MSEAGFLRLLGALAVAATIAILVRLGRHQRQQRRHALVHHPPGFGGEAPLVSILVPARNEARSLAACIESLLAQDHPHLEVLVLDDASGDDTHAIATAIAARDPRLRVFRGDRPRPGWIGKCAALDTLAGEARGSWLLFTDADTVHAPDSLSSGLGFALHHNAEVLTCTGEGVLGSFWERAFESLWPMFLFWWLGPDRLNDPRSSTHFGIGQWLLIARRAYDAIGGHAAVRDAIVEDCALVARARGAGIRCRVALSTRLYRVRMYRSLGEIWEGWSKNIDRALELWGGGPLAGLASAFVLLLVTIAPFLIALRAASVRPAILGALAAFGPALFTLTVFATLRWKRGSGVTSIATLPLTGLLGAGILLNSFLRRRLGLAVSWKGRSYPGGAPSPPRSK